MKPVHSFVVTAKLPEKISKLRELAYNYWWCWNSDARELFQRMDRQIWKDVHHNPVMLINRLSQEKLKTLSEQDDFVRFLDSVYVEFQNYISGKKWFHKNENYRKGKIAYFSPEYGINESFPNYSGGLGVLAGDHLKSASDLGLPLVGVGLLYQQGYFRQHLTQNGWQNELYNYNDFYSLPLVLMKHDNGEPIIIDVNMPYGKAFAQIWCLDAGNVTLFMLDTNIELNGIEEYREITNQLYGGTRDTRIQQEILLGVGGMRALAAIGINPDVIHINEGHAAFALLERTYMFMKKYNVDFQTAKQITKGSSVFTTHTPVPAGNEAFHLDRMGNYLKHYAETIGLTWEEFIGLGQMQGYNPNESFSMTVLGLKMTSYHNGVSELHGRVSREMWHKIWKCFPVDEVPIRGITNGIHTLTWIAREFEELYDRYLPFSWRSDTDNQAIWDQVDNIPGEEIWREKQRRRVRLVLFTREYLKTKQRAFLLPNQINKINEFLNPDALTIGFARRFATYKRAALLFRDMKRLSAILKDPERPVQIILAGKAHPHDTAGKEVIQSIIQKIRDYKLEKHVVFLEDYDMVIARLLVKGADVWLNNPIRPMEASGTSGMKAALNGTLNLSILDGWWDEAYNSKNGFAIGDREERENNEETALIESDIIYNLLENTIKPLFYDRSLSRVPDKWAELMKNAIKTIAGRFSTHRMVKDYATHFYIPALDRYQQLTENDAVNAKQLKVWKEKVRASWKDVEVIDTAMKDQTMQANVGKEIGVTATVSLGNLEPKDVVVQIYHGGVNHHGDLVETKVSHLSLVRSENNYHLYEGAYVCSETGMQGYTIRILPAHGLMEDPAELYLCHWA